ncbi:MAG: hypothetical protein J6P95_03140 [Paludibacteraceae bacterium]|nr:hypothetical protein [Paludibacteraceae bacterium]
MKKLVFLAIILLSLASCEVDNCDCNNSCPNIPTNTVALSTFYIDVKPQDWSKFDGIEKYVFAPFDAPEITENVIKNGLVVSYFVDGDYDNYDNYDNYYYNQLPYVYPVPLLTDTIYENMRFDYKKGVITFIIEDSDMEFAIPTNERKFKVCVFSPN